MATKVTGLRGQAEQITFADNSIDLVVSRGSVFFWEDMEKGISEVYRVLRPGGWAYIGGGFGTKEILDEVLILRANDEEWCEKRKERMGKNLLDGFSNY